MSSLPPNACRLRVRYVKDGRLAFLGHLEVMNTVMRCVRRSGLPFEVGNGFARRMRIQFSQALPVGAASKGEYYDLLLSNPLDAESALAALKAASPRALAPQDARVLPRRIAALEAWVGLSVWDVSVRAEGLDSKAFREGLQKVSERGVIEYMRGEKPRRLVLNGTLGDCRVQDVPGGVDLVLETRATEHGALRPAVLVQAVCGCSPARVCRVGQWHEEADGSRTDPMKQLV